MEVTPASLADLFVCTRCTRGCHVPWSGCCHGHLVCHVCYDDIALALPPAPAPVQAPKKSDLPAVSPVPISNPNPSPNVGLRRMAPVQLTTSTGVGPSPDRTNPSLSPPALTRSGPQPNKSYTCPIAACGAVMPVGPVALPVLERTAHALSPSPIVPCAYAACTERLPLNAFDAHVQRCVHKTWRCPMPNCKFEAPMAVLWGEHLTRAGPHAGPSFAHRIVAMDVALQGKLNTTPLGSLGAGTIYARYDLVMTSGEAPVASVLAICALVHRDNTTVAVAALFGYWYPHEHAQQVLKEHPVNIRLGYKRTLYNESGLAIAGWFRHDARSPLVFESVQVMHRPSAQLKWQFSVEHAAVAPAPKRGHDAVGDAEDDDAPAAKRACLDGALPAISLE